jgi:hypothetical protein
LSPAVVKKLGAIHDLVHGEGIAAVELSSKPEPEPASPKNTKEFEVAKVVREILQQAAQPQGKVVQPPS